jgi:AbrB family looped-hinge helix DNA binding protein
MEVSVTTISRNGQIVIPTDIRKALGIEAFEKFLVFGEGDVIIIKRMNKDLLKKEFEEIMNTFTESFSSSDISREDVEREIKDYRKSKRYAVEDGA